MPEKHLALMVRKQAKKYGERTALRYRENGQWQDISWKEVGERVHAVAKALLEMGIKTGDMVGVFSQNCPEWSIADLGILSVRGVSVPIYATNTAKQTEYIVDEAEIAVLFVGAKDQYQKATSIISASKYLKKIIVFDSNLPLADGDQAVYFKDFLELGRKSTREQELEERLKKADMNDLATLIYTSGTTGEPKGVMLNHSNFYFSFQAHNKRLAVSDQDISMCFLPLSHVFERAWTYFALGSGMVVNYCDDTHQDHRNVARAVITAARYTKNLLFYEVPTTQNFVPTVFSDIGAILGHKVRLLKCHRSQVYKTRVKNLSIIETAKSTAVFRGYQDRVKYAEGFTPQRLLLDLVFK